MQLKKTELQCGGDSIIFGRQSNYQKSFEGNMQLNLQLNKQNSFGASFDKFNKSLLQHKMSSFNKSPKNRFEEDFSNIKLNNLQFNEHDLNLHSKEDIDGEDDSSRRDSQEQHQFDNEENMGNTIQIQQALERNIEKIKQPYTKEN